MPFRFLYERCWKYSTQLPKNKIENETKKLSYRVQSLNTEYSEFLPGPGGTE